MKIKYFLKKVDNLMLPARANETDAGFDVTATSEPKVVGVETNSDRHQYIRAGKWSSISYVEYETNLYFVPDVATTPSNRFSGALDVHHVHTDLRPRSSISSKTNFVLANSVGLIDRGYQNQVLVRFRYVWQPCELTLGPDGHFYGTPTEGKMYKKGDAIAQLLPMLTHDMDFEVVDALPGEDRGGGFGSTDAKKVAATPAPTPTPVVNTTFHLGSRVTIDAYLQRLKNPSLTDIVELWARKYDGDIHSFREGATEGVCIVSSEGQIIGKYVL